MRIRDIVHTSGRRLRIGLDRSLGEDMVVRLSDPHCSGSPVQLDPYGGELLAGFLMSARLAAGNEVAEERSHGLYGCHLRVVPGRAIELSQAQSCLLLPQVLWDRLYAELMLALAHGRHLAGTDPLLHGPLPRPRARLLH